MFSLLKLYYNIHSLINFCKCECYNTNLARKTQLPDDDLKRSKHVGVILSVFKFFMWNICKCNCWLINEVEYAFFINLLTEISTRTARQVFHRPATQ